MKRLSLLVLSLVLLSSVFLFSSCDQDDVDSAQTNLLDMAAGYLGPFFKEASTDLSQNGPDNTTSSSVPNQGTVEEGTASNSY